MLNRRGDGPGRHGGHTPEGCEGSAPVQSLKTVAFATGLYGLIVLMTLAYALSLGARTP